MAPSEYKVYPFRWLLLAFIMPIIISTEILWLTFAFIPNEASAFYSVDAFGIDMFSISYMVMYIVFTVPASWVIDRFGYRVSLAIGAVMTVVFGATRFAANHDFTLALISQFLLAAGQPFLVNVSTKVPANWFPVRERSTASGLLVMAQYIGFVISMLASPLLLKGLGLRNMLGTYAVFALVAAIPAVLLTREKPPVRPGPEAPKEMISWKGTVRLLANWNYLCVLIISFVSMGLFNTLMTKLAAILQPNGFDSTAAGIVGSVFVAAGITGAIAVPILSDKLGKRIPLFIIGISAMGPLLLGLAFVNSFPVLLAAAALLGVLIMGLAPVLFQHGAEVAYPVPEGTSFGLIMLVGQISGFAFVCLFDIIHGFTASAYASMICIAILAVLQVPVTLKMKESQTFLAAGGKREGD